MKLIPACCLSIILSVSGLSRLQAAGHDLVIYGGTSAGIAAAVQAKRMNLTVIVIEPGRRIGGLTTGGLGQTDIGNKAVIGGIAREFYQAVKVHYGDKTAWKWQAPQGYQGTGQSITQAGEDTKWTFEPSAALAIYESWIKRDGIEIVLNERLDRTPLREGSERIKGVVMVGAEIKGLRMESGRLYEGKRFIDATYEGDLLAGAGVGYAVGREPSSLYGETLNGVQTRRAKSHQLKEGIDPWITKGDETSGLLPGIDASGPGAEGGGDNRVQGYCFRMCLTDHPENRIPFVKPPDYKELDYELLFRNYEAGAEGVPWINSAMPNRKTDTNNRDGFSTDFIGQNYEYPQASYAEREKIIAAHRSYQQGLMWTLANHPRIPEKVRAEVGRWGMCKDEFVEGAGWQDQLYVREARRMVSDVVMNQHHCQRHEIVPDSVGMGAYNMDSHNVQRYVDDLGQVRNEGDVQVGVPPYPISYRSIIPKRGQCVNLAVPVCLSSSHIAFGSIRMEPVFMILGQSAATAIALSLEDDLALQDVDYLKLNERLLADKQILEKTPPATVAADYVDLKSLKGIVVDETQATMKGPWIKSALPIGVKDGYWHDGDDAKGECQVTYELTADQDATFHVEVVVHPNENRCPKVPVTLTTKNQTSDVAVDMRKQGDQGLFQRVGTLPLKKGDVVSVMISNAGTEGHVVIDAVRLLQKEP